MNRRKNIPVFSIVAWSGTGKTTYLEKLLPCLAELGLRAAVVKHDGHDFTMDHDGTDTDRLTKAGAAITAIFSENHSAILYNRPLAPESIMEQITDVDLILTEGFKNGMWPKILLYRTAKGGEPAADPDKCAAVVTDKWFVTNTPQFDPDKPEDLARFLGGKVRGNDSWCSSPWQGSEV